MSRAKRWAITLNSCNVFPVCADATYAVYGKETAPSTGTEHIQGYVEFSTLKSLKQLQEYFPGCHAEIAKGSGPQNRDYCTKDGNFQEWGVIGNDKQRQAGKDRGEKERERWKLALEAAKEGRFDDIDADIFLRYDRNIDRIRHKALLSQVKDLDSGLKDGDWALWIYGPTGTGKSRWVKENYPEAYYKNVNKWFDDYKLEETIVIEDVDPSSCEHMARYFKIWSDRYAFPAEYKGGSMKVRPLMFIVTSNYTLEECFKEYNDLVALQRRFKEVRIEDINKLNS